MNKDIKEFKEALDKPHTGLQVNWINASYDDGWLSWPLFYGHCPFMEFLKVPDEVKSVTKDGNTFTVDTKDGHTLKVWVFSS